MENIAGEAENVNLSISKAGFDFAGQIINRESKGLNVFSREFFQRNIKLISFSRHLSIEELVHFLQTLGDDPKKVRDAGGIERVLAGLGVKNITANEVDYETILEQIRLEERTEEEIAAEEPADLLDNLLEQPKQKEELFGEVFEELHSTEEKEALSDLKDVFISHKDIFDILLILLTEKNEVEYTKNLNNLVNLCHHVKGERRNETILKITFFLALLSRLSKPPFYNHKALVISKQVELSTIDIITLAIDKMTAGVDKNREKSMLFFWNLGEECIGTLFHYLAQKGDLNTRHIISNIAAMFGKKAYTQIEPWLTDNRWYVVCGAVAVIGNIAHEAGLKYLIPMLEYEDIRVKRETVKALGNIRDTESLNLLTLIIKSEDPDLIKQAIISLGKLQFEVAIPDLIKLSKSGVFIKNNLDIRRAAVTALGKTGSVTAIPPLLNILRDISFLKKEENDELRILAAKAIGEIGGEEAVQALEIASNSHKPIIQNACKKMLEKVIEKIKEDELYY